MITLDAVSVRYGASETAALDHITLDVAAGEHVAVSGPLDAGASTLLRLLNGVVPQLVAAQVDGRIRVAGLDPGATPVHAMAGRVGLVLDDPGLATTQGTVAEEVAFGLESLGVPPAAMRPRVEAALRDVGLGGLGDRDPATLSGGELQRLAIAAVLVMEPAVLVLDEPATNLDPAGAAAVLDILRRLVRERGVTVVRADRDACGAASGATRVVALEAGVITSDASPTVAAAADEVGALVRTAASRPARTAGEPVLVMTDVAVRYPQAAVFAIDGISLSVGAGEVVGVCGPNGGGKSTLAQLATGVLRPSRGGVLVGGLDTRRRGPPRGLAAVAGLVFQDPRHQLLAATVREELALGLRALRLPTAEVVARVTDAAARFALGGQLDRHPLRLGRTQRKVLAIAAIRAMRPRLLVLDEPTIGADARLRALIAHEIAAAAGEGTAVLVLSHDLRLLAEVADRLVVIAAGRVTGDGMTADMLADQGFLTSMSLRPATTS